KRAYCLKTQPATGETYPKSDLFNKAHRNARLNSWQNTPQKRTSVGVVWVIAHVGLKRKL
ncbi:hypothetical protein, partial [Escherichia coli]|uniref:hypothetical protein n=1 Tax=Escherichia coli TaxID=562 RepID=UPI001C689485